jgi:hypothetical protein
MVNSPYLMEDIKGSASALLVAAVKLRNALLFRECVVWTVSIWSNREPEKDIVDPKLRIIVRNAYRSVVTKVANVQYHLANTLAQ